MRSRITRDACTAVSRKRTVGGDLNFILYVLQEKKEESVVEKVNSGASSDQSISNSEDGDSSIMIMTVMSPRVKMSSEC